MVKYSFGSCINEVGSFFSGNMFVQYGILLPHFTQHNVETLNIPFDAFFETAPPAVVLLPNIPTFTVLAANPAYLKVTGTAITDVLGIGFLEAFPENPDDPITDNVVSLKNSLIDAVVNKHVTTLPGQRYDIPVRGTHTFETRYWTATNSPVLNEHGEISCIVHTTLDITNAYNLAKKERIAHEVTEAQRKQLNESFKQAPLAVALVRGQEHIIEAANDKMLEFVGKKEGLLGEPLAVAVPRVKALAILHHLDAVFYSGQPYHGQEIHMILQPDTKPIEKYFNIFYDPIFNDSGNTTSILIMVADVTEQVMARKDLERVVEEKTDAQEQLQLAIESAQLGTWFINAETMDMQASPRLKEIWGFYPDEEMTYEAALNQIPEAHQQKVMAAIEACIKQKVDYDIEHPVIGRHNHQLRWVRATGRLYDGKREKPAHFSGTIVDITERKRDEQRKNDFISIVSHELKTPLTSVKAYAELLQGETELKNDPFQKSMLLKMQVQLNRMQRMIGGFLSIAAMESGRLQLLKENFDLSETIKEMTEEASIASPRYHLHFSSCGALPVEADKDKMGQVITNLLSNAIKYSPHGSDVFIACDKQDQQVVVSIKDQGMGIKPEHISRLFERFYRVESEKMKGYSGFGIGLYLCAEIIERHGGTIGVESKEGEGSTFFFTLPMATASTT